jgi:MtN3 and saliva related transmembrane protein
MLAATTGEDRARQADRAFSLPATVAFTGGVGLWLIYGLAINDWPLIGANAVMMALMVVILAMKLRYG